MIKKNKQIKKKYAQNRKELFVLLSKQERRKKRTYKSWNVSNAQLI